MKNICVKCVRFHIYIISLICNDTSFIGIFMRYGVIFFCACIVIFECSILLVVYQYLLVRYLYLLKYFEYYFPVWGINGTGYYYSLVLYLYWVTKYAISNIPICWSHLSICFNPPQCSLHCNSLTDLFNDIFIPVISRVIH